MTKVYLVYKQGCNPNGTVDLKSQKYVLKVFTSKRLALKCAEYMNENWILGFQRNADFKKEKISFYHTETRIISHDDYSKLPF